MKKLLILGSLLICLWFLTCGGSSPVAAQTASETPDQTEEESKQPATWLQISPVANYLNITPGGHYEGYVDVINNGTEIMEYVVYAKPYRVSGITYDPIFEGETSQTMLASWVSIATPSGSLASMETARILYTVDVPQDIPDGGQYGVVFVETGGAPDEAAPASIVTKHRLGHLLFAEIDGKTRLEGQVLEQSWPWFWWRGPITANSLIENTGNSHFVANYQLSQRSFFSGPGAERVIPESVKQYTVLPATQREVNLRWEDEAPNLGLFWLTQELSFLDTTVEKTQLVFIWPPIALVILAVCIFIGIVIYLMWLWQPNKKTD